jgi:hypothetical protein
MSGDRPLDTHKTYAENPSPYKNPTFETYGAVKGWCEHTLPSLEGTGYNPKVHPGDSTLRRPDPVARARFVRLSLCYASILEADSHGAKDVGGLKRDPSLLLVDILTSVFSGMTTSSCCVVTKAISVCAAAPSGIPGQPELIQESGARKDRGGNIHFD